MFTVSNALLMSSATVIVRSGGLFRLKPVAMVLFMLCSAVLVEWMVCAVYMSGGGRMSEKEALVSVVNCVQFAFL